MQILIIVATAAQLICAVVVVLCTFWVRKAARIQMSAIPTMLTSLEEATICAQGGPNGYTMYGVEYPSQPPDEQYEKNLAAEMELDPGALPVHNEDDEELAIREAEGETDLDPATRQAVYRRVRNSSRRAATGAETA